MSGRDPRKRPAPGSSSGSETSDESSDPDFHPDERNLDQDWSGDGAPPPAPPQHQHQHQPQAEDAGVGHPVVAPAAPAPAPAALCQGYAPAVPQPLLLNWPIGIASEHAHVYFLESAGLRAASCTHVAAPGATCCANCGSLALRNDIRMMQQRANNPQLHLTPTTNKYLSYEQMQLRIEAARAERAATRMQLLASNRGSRSLAREPAPPPVLPSDADDAGGQSSSPAGQVPSAQLSKQPTAKAAGKPKVSCLVGGCHAMVGLEQMRQHVGAHVLKGDIALAAGQQACGFCGQVVSAARCTPCLTQGSTPATKKMQATLCPRFHNASWAAAAKGSALSPCTNVPYKCQLCSEEVHVWKYHMLDHIQQQHPEHAIAAEDLEKFAVTLAEFKAVMGKQKWDWKARLQDLKSVHGLEGEDGLVTKFWDIVVEAGAP